MAKPPSAEALTGFREHFSEAITSSYEALGEVTFYVDPSSIVEICTYLRDDPQLDFNMLADLCGVDLGIDQEPRFEVVYHLNSLTKFHRLRLKAQIIGDEPSIATLTGVWKTANWLERETYDMYGINFEGHPDLRRILMPEEFQWHPLRKDYPVRGYDDF